MKLQLDTAEKTIKVLEDVSLDALVKALNGILPNGEWKKYKLQTNAVVNNWSYPVYIDRWQPQPSTYPWEYRPITTSGTVNVDGISNSLSTPTTCYNIEVN